MSFRYNCADRTFAEDFCSEYPKKVSAHSLKKVILPSLSNCTIMLLAFSTNCRYLASLARSFTGPYTQLKTATPVKTASKPPPNSSHPRNGEFARHPPAGIAANCQEPLGKVTSSSTGLF